VAILGEIIEKCLPKDGGLHLFTDQSVNKLIARWILKAKIGGSGSKGKVQDPKLKSLHLKLETLSPY